MKTLCAAALIAATCCGTAQAGGYGEYIAPVPGRLFPHGRLTGAYAFVPPYGPLPIRVYDTPQQGPYYNVPPYPVVTPY